MSSRPATRPTAGRARGDRVAEAPTAAVAPAAAIAPEPASAWCS